jgi:hypothetical protein
MLTKLPTSTRRAELNDRKPQIKNQTNRNAEKSVHNRNTEKNHATQTEQQQEENKENKQETSDQEEQNKTPYETAQILKEIICKNLKKHMQTSTQCTPGG